MAGLGSSHTRVARRANLEIGAPVRDTPASAATSGAALTSGRFV